MTEPDYTNTWGSYYWTPEDGKDLIHPDEYDPNRFHMGERFTGKIFYCSGMTTDGYLILQYDKAIYRVRPKIYRVIPTPRFNYGDTVRYKADVSRLGEIRHIGWHHNQKREYYYLRIGERKSTRRYFNDELELVPKSSI